MATIVYGTFGTNANTADQTIVTNTPSATTSFKAISCGAYLTTYSATEAALGLINFRQAAAKKCEFRMQNTDLASLASVIVIPWGDGITFNGSDAIDWVCTPASASLMTWSGSMWGQG
jgi:hypothetical protein